MNKRSFLKATGVTFVVSLFAAPFLGRRESASVAQENDWMSEIKKLREEFDNKLAEERAVREDSQRKLESELVESQRKLESGLVESQKKLEAGFVGSVVAIPYGGDEHPIPSGWHLCDGTAIPNTDEYVLLKSLTGLTRFPDYRGVFLRGLDEKTQDGTGDARGFDPGRTLDGKVQDSENKEHRHGSTMDEGGLGGVTKVRFSNPAKTEGKYYFTNVDEVTSAYGEYVYPYFCNDFPSSGGKESRPKNVAVRYIIKCW